MSDAHAGCAPLFLWCIIIFFAFHLYNTILFSRDYSAQQQIAAGGVAAEATIERVKHPGIQEWGKVYARFGYTVGSDEYQTDVQLMNRSFRFPSGKVREGKTVVTISYDPADPVKLTYAGILQTVKTERNWSIAALVMDSVLLVIVGAGMIISAKANKPG